MKNIRILSENFHFFFFFFFFFVVKFSIYLNRCVFVIRQVEEISQHSFFTLFHHISNDVLEKLMASMDKTLLNIQLTTDKNLSSRKHAYIILTPLNPTFI